MKKGVLPIPVISTGVDLLLRTRCESMRQRNWMAYIYSRLPRLRRGSGVAVHSRGFTSGYYLQAAPPQNPVNGYLTVKRLDFIADSVQKPRINRDNCVLSFLKKKNNVAFD